MPRCASSADTCPASISSIMRCIGISHVMVSRRYIQPKAVRCTRPRGDGVPGDVVQGEMTMRDKEPTLPPTMPCLETGRELRRDTRPFTVRYKAHEVVVDLPGYYPDGDGESVHVGADMAAADEALRRWKEQVDGLPSPATIRRIRHKLRLSQRAAGAVFRVGARAFDKYERRDRKSVVEG